MKVKDDWIKFRIAKSQKRKWKRICKQKQISLTDLIVDSVEGRLSKNDRRELLKFIEKQDNIFSKIENNINQYARYANAKKFINSSELKEFNKKMALIVDLKAEQNKMFLQIYNLIGAYTDDN